ncbi:MAG: ethanolamine ammonia-lyase subunit EutC [Chloroflexi bacterium]|nr:ethanolamine ammonia-lyase subunit EutC [Chloroflexota bacterium]
MDEAKVNQIVETIMQELIAAGVVPKVSSSDPEIPRKDPSPLVVASKISGSEIERAERSVNIDLPDPAMDEFRYHPRVLNPLDPAALKNLIASTTARIGVGHAGPRYKTSSQLLFQGDHAITQDAIYREIDPKILSEFNLFSVQTKVTEGKEQYLLRPDLGRQLSEEAKKVISEKCTKNPAIQLVVGDGLSTTAIEANLRQIYPLLLQGFQSAGLNFGTPFYVKYCRVGVMNDIGDILQPEVVILLIGERPGLGRADSMSAYMGYKPKTGDNDANRDVICNIFENGGTNPLEAGAYIVQFAQKMLHYKTSGVKLKLEMK